MSSGPASEPRAASSNAAPPIAPLAAASIDVRAPAEQEEGSRSTILRWLKRVGDLVAQDEPLMEIETDKVTVELAAPASGVLTAILKAESEEVAPGELLARIASTEAAPPQTEAAPRPTEEALAAAKPMAGAATRTARAAMHEASKVPESLTEARRPLSPAVRRLLADRSIDPAAIQGSGEGGRITVDDVLSYSADPLRLSASRAGGASAASGASAPGGASARGASGTDGRLVPHSPTRRRIAERMVQSLLHTAPHVTTVFEADFTAVLAHRARHRDALATQGIPLTLTAYLLAACVDAIRAVPESNARWTDDALEIFDEIHIGVGTAVEEKGLIVPVVRDVPARSLNDLARELGRLVALARDDRLQPADVRGATFTISNHGVSGSLIAAPIVINQPQVAILGVGRVESRPVVVEEEGETRVVPRPRAYVTLTIDHRAMDGHRANRFLGVLVQRLESWPGE